jgi:class 3 adenylate cyclase
MDNGARSSALRSGSARPELDSLRDGALITDLDRVRLRFRSPELEKRFRTHFANHNVTNLRVGHVLAIVMWVAWGPVIQPYLGADRGFDLFFRYGLMIPLTTLSFALTFLKSYPRIWKWPMTGVLLVTGLGWITYAMELKSMPVDYGYVGLILIQTFAFSILRLPFALVVLYNLVTIPYYFAIALSSGELQGVETLLAVFYVGSFTLLGLIASYVLEWKIRKLFIRERQLDAERGRSDALLLNILPSEIIHRLKSRRAAREEGLVEAFVDVTVLFADAVDFTVQAAKTTPDDLVVALDGFFSQCDALADRFGLEKIKTVGDAYMAVAGVPRPRHDHAQAAAEMALAVLRELEGSRWPSGDPIVVRVGIASGPAVAGVIGRRKFAYDLWGDTVNLASRLESHSHPGRILASESVVAHLEGSFEFGPPMVVDLKGKGPTPARFLLPQESPAPLDPRLAAR